MPRVCSICGLSNKRGRESGVFLHELPADTVRRKQWVDAVYKLTGEHRMLQWQTVNYTICSRHFNKSDYKPEYKIRILERNVIPTILGPPPEPRTRAAPVREATNGRLSDKDLELALVRVASSASTPENAKTVEKTAPSRKKKVVGKPATPSEDTAAIPRDMACDQEVGAMLDEISVPRKKKVVDETSVPRKKKADDETSAPRKKKAEKTSLPRKKRAGDKTSVPRKKNAVKTSTVSDKEVVEEDAIAVTDEQRVVVDRTAESKVGIFEDPMDVGDDRDMSDDEDAETSDEEDGDRSPRRRRSEGATTTQQRLAAMRRKTKNLRRQLTRRNARVLRLRQRLVDALRARRASEAPCRAENRAFATVLQEAQQGDLRAQFLVEQVCNFGKQKTRWSEPFIRECVLLCSVSAPTYDLVRTSPLLKGAPSRTTLKRFIGCSVKEGEVGKADDTEDEEEFILKMEEDLGNTDEVEEEMDDLSDEQNALGDTMEWCE